MNHSSPLEFRIPFKPMYFKIWGSFSYWSGGNILMSHYDNSSSLGLQRTMQTTWTWKIIELPHYSAGISSSAWPELSSLRCIFPSNSHILLCSLCCCYHMQLVPQTRNQVILHSESPTKEESSLLKPRNLCCFCSLLFYFHDLLIKTFHTLNLGY